MRNQSFKQHAATLGILSIFLALSLPGQAEVIYTPVNVTVSGNGSIAIDLNHDGVSDFTVSITGRKIFCAGTGWGSFGYVTVTPSRGDGVVPSWPGGSYAAALKTVVSIDSSNSFYKSQALMAQYSTCVWPPHDNFGNWIGVRNRYLGLVFLIDDRIHYGWARLTVKVGPTGPIVTLTGYAYESVAGEKILTDQQ